MQVIFEIAIHAGVGNGILKVNPCKDITVPESLLQYNQILPVLVLAHPTGIRVKTMAVAKTYPPGSMLSVM